MIRYLKQGRDSAAAAADDAQVRATVEGMLGEISTRGDATPRAFCDILLEGLAPDGGLYLPQSYSQVDTAMPARWPWRGPR